ncbi:putative dehydrogenase [Sporosarcina luteola]|nr:putative dehydrogenase [Sporosarcina luteola]
MRVGIIGGGFGLHVQAPLVNLHPNMNVTAVSTMNRHELPAKLIRDDHSSLHYKDWNRMLDREELDLLFVSSMPIYHFEMVKKAIEMRIPVVCEKPFTMNSKESIELLQLSKKYNTKVLIDFEWRYLPVRQKMKEMISNKEIGEIIHTEYHVTSPMYQSLHSAKRGWMGKRQFFGGMLGAVGTHMLDCVRWLTEDEVETISGLTSTHIPEGAEEHRDADDAFFIHGTMKRRSTFSLQVITGIQHGFGSSLKVYGSLGTITLTNDKTLCAAKANETFAEVEVPVKEIPYALSGEAARYYAAFYPFLEKIYEYVAEDHLHKDLPTVEDAHANQLILDKILKLG